MKPACIKSVIFRFGSSLFFATFLAIGVCPDQTLAQSERPEPRFDDRPHVVTTSPALHAIAAIVLGDVIDPGLLVRPGKSSTTVAVNDEQMRLLSQSDLVLSMDALLGSGVVWDWKKVAAQAKHVDLSLVSGMGKFRGNRQWLDPVAIRVMGGVIVELVSALDPERFEIYFGNIAVLEERMQTLQRDITKRLASYRNVSFRVLGSDLSAYAERFQLSGYQASDPLCVLSTEATDVERGLATALLDDLGKGVAPGPDFVEIHLRQMTDQILQCLKQGGWP